MKKKVVQLPFGTGYKLLEVEENLLGEVVKPSAVTAVPDMQEAIQDAIANPIGTPRLGEIVQAGQTVAIAIDDITRATPTAVILPLLIAELEDAGIRSEDICIVIALGTHRILTDDEIVSRTGAAIAKNYRVINKPSWDDDAHTFLGTSSNGIPAWVKREVAEADIKIGLGTVIPHMDAGFSGGAKIILPGVCNSLTVDAFHEKEIDIEGNMLGRIDSPLRVDMEKFVGEQVGLDFIVNVVVTPNKALYYCAAGHFIKAHRACVAYAEAVYGVPIQKRYPLVFACAYPKDIDLWQCTNAIWSGEKMVSDGGMLVLVGEVREGNSVYPHFPHYIGRDPDELKAAMERDEIEDRKAAVFAIGAGEMKQRIQIGVVSEGITREMANQMGFIYFDSLETAVAAEQAALTEESIGVLIQGAVTLPMLTQ